MSKKKNRPPRAAQNLIDSLLAEQGISKSGEFTGTKTPTEPVRSDEPTASIINLQEKIEERSQVSRVRKEAFTDDRTIAVENPAEKPEPSTSPNPVFEITEGGDPAIETIDRMMPTEIKTRMQIEFSQTPKSGARLEPKEKVATPNYAQSSGVGFTSVEAALKQSNAIRLVQERNTQLEKELESLRRENENLSTAGETLRRRADELLSKTEQLEAEARENLKTHDQEKTIYRGQLHQKDRDLADLRTRLEQMEGRLDNNFKKIRVRERELEHRLEIIKMESATLISTKDKMILELKRQIDQLAHESSYSKQKSAELFNQFKGKQDTIRRVVRALRIALTILEGDEDASGTAKKNDP